MKMKEKREYIRNTGYVLLANFAVLAVGFFSRPLIARLLRPEEYGIYAIILSTAAFLPVFILFSLNIGVLYYAAKNPLGKFIRELVSSSTAFVLIASALLFIPLYAASGFFLKDVGFEVFLASYVLAVSLSLFYISQSVQQGVQKFKGLGAANAVSSVAAAVIAVFLAYSTRNAVLIGLSRAIVMLVVAFAVFRSFGGFGAFNKQTLRKLFDYSKVLGFVSIITSPIGVLDRYLLLWFKNTAQVGFYDIANALGTMILPFVSSLLITLSPAIIRNSEKLKAYYDQILISTTVFLTLFAVVLFYFSDVIVTLLLGKTYAPSVLPLKITALALPAMALYSLNVATLNSINKTKITGVLNLFLVAGMVVFSLLLIPPFGPEGAAAANLAAFLLFGIAGTLYLSRKFSVGLIKPCVQMLLFAIAIACYYAVENYGFAAKLAVALAFAAITFVINRRIIAEITEHAIAVMAKR